MYIQSLVTKAGVQRSADVSSVCSRFYRWKVLVMCAAAAVVVMAMAMMRSQLYTQSAGMWSLAYLSHFTWSLNTVYCSLHTHTLTRSVCLSLSLSVCLSVCLCMSLCVPVCLSVCVLVCLSLCACISVCLSVCLYVCLSVCPCLSVCVCPYACLFVSVCLYVCLPLTVAVIQNSQYTSISVVLSHLLSILCSNTRSFCTFFTVTLLSFGIHWMCLWRWWLVLQVVECQLSRCSVVHGIYVDRSLTCR